MGKVLYRKYRPWSLDDVVGQEHVTTMLRNAIKNDRIAHAYLLTGPRGTGKTSIARILAHDINGLAYSDESMHLDIIEIDAASNNSVEDVRDLREKVHIAPVSARKKVYIIDEVHMLSKPAFNALLKTLEEPPEHIVFILATTDVEKLPQTIISRVQRFNFSAVPLEKVVERLRAIADAEKISIDDDALMMIAQYGGGSFRDSIGLLDQLGSLSDDDTPISGADVARSLGGADPQLVTQLLDAYKAKDAKEIRRIITELEQSATSVPQFVKQLVTATMTRIDESPRYMALLDKITNLELGAFPYIRLLLAMTETSPKHVAAATQTDVIEVPTRPIEKPKMTKPSPQPVQKTEKQTDEKPASEKSEAPAPRLVPSEFDWNTFVAVVRELNPATGTLLSQSDYDIDGTKLTIYAKQSFKQKRLESARYQSFIHEVLARIGADAIEITILPTTKPSDNSTVRDVAAIMGGGEEVTINE